MTINEILNRTSSGEVIIVDTTMQTISPQQRGDNFDEFFNWLEDSPGEIRQTNGEPWVNRNKVPQELYKKLPNGDLIVQNDEPNGILWLFQRRV